MAIPSSAEFAVISDLDDTVIHTGITSLLLAAKLTFLKMQRPANRWTVSLSYTRRSSTGASGRP